MASTVTAPTALDSSDTTVIGKAKWTRVSALGFTLVAGCMALWIVGGLLAGQTLGVVQVAFMGGGGLVALIAAAATWRFGTAGKVVAIVLGLLLMALLPFVAISLGQPDAFVEFSGAVMFALGVFTGVGYSVAAIVRRRDLHTEATRGEMRAMRIMLGITALALVVSGVLNLATRSSVDAAAATNATATATLSDFQFVPATFEATAHEVTTFLVHNGDAFTHDFAIDALDINAGMIAPGSEKLVEVNAPAGQYLVRCTLHSNPDTAPADAGKNGDMSALLTVE